MRDEQQQQQQQLNESTATATSTPSTIAEAPAPTSKRAPSNNLLVKGYLLTYNIFCWALWTYALFVTISFVLKDRSVLLSTNSRLTWFASVGPLVKLSMSLALLEILHAGVAFVRASPVTTAVQVLSRLHVIYLIWRLVPTADSHYSTVLTILAWSLAEVLRYPYYIFNLSVGAVGTPHTLKWLRYSAFLLLYPLGISGECLGMLHALPILKKSFALSHYPTPMPNALNFEISLHAVYVIVLIAYIPGSFYMYNHMLIQRKKVLSPKVHAA